ncbi:MAG TPA: hypothetical protein DIT79_05460 [Ruminococcaceae bacterium]|jgi:hypothetical protein|nr:hypothetical protein [Oscillospiraceae bacterium]
MSSWLSLFGSPQQEKKICSRKPLLFFDGFSIIEAVKKSFTFGNRSLLKKVGENFNHARRKHNPSGTITQISKEVRI